MTSNDKTDKQLVTYVYLIFQKSGIFMNGLKLWNKKTAQDSTFTNFKTPLRKEYSDLQEVGSITINNSSLNQVKMIQEIKDHQDVISNNLRQEFTKNLMQTYVHLVLRRTKIPIILI